MRSTVRAVAVVVLGVAALAGAAACGERGSSGTQAPIAVTGAGCAPVAGDTLVVLTDAKQLQTADNIIPVVNTKAADPALMAALDKVSTALDTPKLIALNKAVDVDRKTPKIAAQEFATREQLTTGLARGPGGNVVIGAALQRLVTPRPLRRAAAQRGG